MLEKGIHNAESIATTELQQILSVFIQSRDSMFSDHILTRICVLCVPTCALKSPIRTADSVGDTRRKASFTLLTNARYSLVALGAYTCNRHNDQSNTLSFNVQTRDPKESNLAHSPTTGSLWESPYRLSRHSRISTRIEEFPSAIQIHRSRATSFGWRNSDNIEMILLCFLKQF